MPFFYSTFKYENFMENDRHSISIWIVLKSFTAYNDCLRKSISWNVFNKECWDLFVISIILQFTTLIVNFKTNSEKFFCSYLV